MYFIKLYMSIAPLLSLCSLSVILGLNLGPDTCETHSTAELYPQTRTICLFKKAIWRETNYIFLH